MALRSVITKIVAAIAMLVTFSFSAVETNAQRFPRPVYRPPVVVRPPPVRPPVVRPPVRPPSVGGVSRPGPAIRAPIRPGGIGKPTGIGIGAGVRGSSIALPKPTGGLGAAQRGPVAIKPGANVSLKPITPTKTLLTKLKTSTSVRSPGRGGSNLAAGRPDFRAIKANAARRLTGTTIQALRQNLRKLGGPLAPTQCAGVGSCPPEKGKVYQKAKLNQEIDKFTLESVARRTGKYGLLGARGAVIASATLFTGRDGGRLDVENPAPGKRAGQIHYQISQNKYTYDQKLDKFVDDKSKRDAPSAINGLLKDAKFRSGINKGMKYLGETE